MRRINLYITAFLLLVLVVYLAFLDTLAKPVFERLATEQYGAEVSIDSLSLQPFMGRATLFELQVVDRRNAMQNLVQADRVYVDIDMIKLAESVIDVSDMEIDGLLAFAPRETAGVRGARSWQRSRRPGRRQGSERARRRCCGRCARCRRLP